MKGFGMPPWNPLIPGRVQPAKKPVAFPVVTQNQWTPQANNTNAMASEGLTMVGTVKSYNSAKGFGFLQCESAPGQDIFFSKQVVNPNFQEAKLAGMSATFLLSFAADGKPQARLVAPTGGGGQAAGMGAPAGLGGHAAGSMAAPARVGRQTSMVAPAGGGSGGLAWGKGGAKGDKGSCLTSDAMWNSMMELMSGAQGMGSWGKGGNGWCKGGNGSGQGWGNAWCKSGSSSGMVRDQAMTGVIKSYSDKNGFGFIQSPTVPTDIYFKGNGQTFVSGQAVAFYLNHAPDGKAQARGVTVGLSEGETVIGSVKSFNAGKGFGFVEVPDRPGDIYFKRNIVPDEMQGEDIVGKQVQVTIYMTPDGKPQASTLEFVDGGLTDGGSGGLKRAMGNWNNSQPKRAKEEPDDILQMMLEGGECEGCVKSYSRSKGWGFINTDVVPQDVYFKGEFPEAKPGTPCRFTLNYAPDGRPQAHNLEM